MDLIKPSSISAVLLGFLLVLSEKILAQYLISPVAEDAHVNASSGTGSTINLVPRASGRTNTTSDTLKAKPYFIMDLLGPFISLIGGHKMELDNFFHLPVMNVKFPPLMSVKSIRQKPDNHCAQIIKPENTKS